MAKRVQVDAAGQPVPNATVVIYGILGVYTTDATGGVNIPDPPTDCCVKVQGVPNYQTTIFSPLLKPAQGNICIGRVCNGPGDNSLGDLKPNFPEAPTREKVLGVNLTFQGLTVITQQYGTLPWFEAALAWLNPSDRQSVYNVKHAAGDSHCIIQLPFGSLYNEPGQPYATFPDLDWTNSNTSISPEFNNLVIEVIENGFTPIIFPNEEQDQSLIQMQMIIKSLQSSPVGDLIPYCILMTGWDGVFYGWPGGPDAVVKWGAAMRALAPNAYLGIEHDPGHIPLGEGGDDYQPNGRMKDFDVVFGEFSDDGNPPGYGNDTLWQILGRMIRPYNRPSDQIGDPNPPFYLTDSPRGPRFYIALEYNTKVGEYAWVRGYVTAAEINDRRNYIKAMGSKYNG